VTATRPPCGARTRSGGRCAKQAGWGTPDHARTGPCRLHGGSTRYHRTAAARVAVRQAAQFAAVARVLLDRLALTPDQQAAVPGALRAAVAELVAPTTGNGSVA
jgi:hypothetical protein